MKAALFLRCLRLIPTGQEKEEEEEEEEGGGGGGEQGTKKF